MNTIGECAARKLCQDTGYATDGECDAYIDSRPPRACQIESQKRAKADLHVGNEKIGPVEPAAALIADGAIDIAPPPAMLGNKISCSRGITANRAQPKNRTD